MHPAGYVRPSAISFIHHVCIRDLMDAHLRAIRRHCIYRTLAPTFSAAMAFYFSSAFESLGASPTMDSFMAGVKKQAYAFMALGGIIFVTITIQSVLIETAAAEMTRELKNGWFRALLRQDLAFYDIRDVPGQASLITTSAVRFRKGVGRKLADAVQFTVGFIGSIAYGFIASWYVLSPSRCAAPTH